jgi:predicted ATPase
LNPKRIVITGGPGTGKTSIVKLLEASGFYCYHEIIRDMTLEAKKDLDPQALKSNPLAFVDDPMEFNQSILKGRIAQHQAAIKQQVPVVFYDRGIPDVLAYMNYFKQEYESEFENACMELRYDEVILLPPWKEIYISDNERFESFDEAMAIHDHLEDTYKEFNYMPLDVPKKSVEARAEFILETLKLLT